MGRRILHVDLDAFFCSVEQLRQPSLEDKAFVVGGSPSGRGVVSSASYRARQFGIRSAMPTAQALRLCPELIVLPSNFQAYRDMSSKVMSLLRESAPRMEQLSIDEAFLDLVDDPRPARRVAETLQRRIRAQFGLPTSWGVASNKLVAKIATEVGKPEGLVVVPVGEEADFLAPLPVQMLWGVGPKTREALTKLDVRTIGDVAALPTNRLRSAVGDRAVDLKARALGHDDRELVESREPKSMSAETTFSRDTADQARLEATLLELSERVAARLRRSGYAGSTVRMKLRWPDFSTLTRQKQLAQPTDQDGEISRAALGLFHSVWRPGRQVRLLGVGVSDLGPPSRQLELFDQRWQEDERLLQAVDRIRAKFGPESLRRAVQLGRAPEGTEEEA